MALTAEEIQQLASALAAAQTQAAAQTAQQIAEQVGQAVSQAITKAMQTFTQTTGTTAGVEKTVAREELGDVGGTEGIEADLILNRGLLFANNKRAFDEYLRISLSQVEQNQTYVNKVLSDALQFDNQRQVIANQALSHLVETGNMVGKNATVNLDNLQKQHTAHRDLATDRTWNVDESGYQAEQILKAMDPTTAITVLGKILADMATKTAAAGTGGAAKPA